MPPLFMFNTVQIVGLALLGGLVAGEASRRLLDLPRTTGYVVFGLVVGQSGLNWITATHLESAQVFIDLALGLIVFELGHLVPQGIGVEGGRRVVAGLVISLVSAALIALLLASWGFSAGASLFAAALCVATSPAITIATCSDVGARGERSGLLYTLVAVNGAVAFSAVVIIAPFLMEGEPASTVGRLVTAMGSIFESLVLAGACAGIVLAGAERLARQSEHQHVLILGTIVLGVGTAVYLDISVFLPMLMFGILVRRIDRGHKVIAVRIAGDARVFLVITFVCAGAGLDIADLVVHWQSALMLALTRCFGQVATTLLVRPAFGFARREALFLGIGLQPMSSIAIVLLVNMQTLYAGLDGKLVSMVMATILLMQLLGPLATQTAIQGFGEATRLVPRRRPVATDSAGESPGET